MKRTCPHCHGANIRRSSTPAGEVTWRNRFLSRYRCRDCLTRFWGISRKMYVFGTTLLAAALVTALAMFVVDSMYNSEYSVPSQERSEAVPRPHSAFDTLAGTLNPSPTLRS